MGSSFFRSADELLIQYAMYHRDQRNISTHLLGIPLIVLALAMLLTPAAIEWRGLQLTAAWCLWGLLSVWYLRRGRLGLGVAVSAGAGMLFALAHWGLQGQPEAALSWGLTLFVAGWLLQFIGHYYEGRKPAFVDDLVGLLVGPMFVTAEALFALGIYKDLQTRILGEAGPTRLRDLASPAA